MQPPRSADAAPESSYTLPFYASYAVNCGFGVSYTSCEVDLPGTNQGIDYSVGNNITGGEVIVAAAGGINAKSIDGRTGPVYRGVVPKV